MLTHKKYKTYDEYLVHQKSKTAKMYQNKEDIENLTKLNAIYRSGLKRTTDIFDTGTTVLCLGARQGGEVQAFIELGCFAVGIDILPTPENKYVVWGDFNNIQYADSSVDVVFTNSLDHTNDIRNLVREVCRVLKPGGRFITELLLDGRKDLNDKWACCLWSSQQDVVDLLSEYGFILQEKIDVSKTTVFGTQLRFRKNE